MLATETDGNPFFLRETLLHLVEDGRLRFEDGVWVADPTRELGIPAGVRDVIGRRLSRLLAATPTGCSRRAHCSRCRSRSRSRPTSPSSDEDEALDAIDEALEAAHRRADRRVRPYAFTHTLFRHTLVEELNPSRQVRMHRAIAEAIEKELRGPPDPATAATLARHYLRSAAIPGAERGVPYTIAVADDAAGRYTRHEELRRCGPRSSCSSRTTNERSMLRRTAIAAVLAVIDPDDQLAAAEGRRPCSSPRRKGADAACDFVVDLMVAAGHLEDITVCWRLASLARRWLSPERQTRRGRACATPSSASATTTIRSRPGIPTGDDDYRELRAVIATLLAGRGKRLRHHERSRFTGGGRGSPGPKPSAHTSAWASGNVRRCSAPSTR